MSEPIKELTPVELLLRQIERLERDEAIALDYEDLDEAHSCAKKILRLRNKIADLQTLPLPL